MNSNVSGWRRYTFVEPSLFLFMFAQTLVGAVITDLMVYRSCQSIMGIDKNECDILHSNSSSERALYLEAKSQPHASYILMCKSFVDGILPAFLSFFLGPWSDKYGRKPLLVAGYFGAACSFLLWTILCSLNIDPWLYLLSSVPSALMGGYCGVILASLCFVTDTRTCSDRTWHLTFMGAAISAGLCAGIFAGSIIFNALGYVAVFGVASTCCGVATLYSIFIVPETVVRTDETKSWCSLFDVNLVKDVFVTCTKKRDGFNRSIVWCSISVLSLNILVMEGESNIGYLFASVKFGWNVKDYSAYQATAMLTGIVGSLLGARFFRAFVDTNLSDMGIAVFACASYFTGAMTRAFSSKPWHLYLSTSLAMYGGLVSPVLRAILATSAPPQDIGKIYSLTTSMETVVPLAASPLYTLIYTRYMPPIYPIPVYLVSAMFYATMMVIVIVIDRVIAKLSPSRYAVIDEVIN